MTKEAKRIIDELYNSARTEYTMKQQAIKEIEELDLEELDRRMDDPGFIQNNKLAVNIA